MKDFVTPKQRLGKTKPRPKRTSLRKFLKNTSTLMPKRADKKTVKLVIEREWDLATVNDFLSDFLDISSRNPDKSIRRILSDLLVRFVAGNIPVDKAESMVIGIEWYLNNEIIRKTKGLK